ncbi:MAG: 1-deoxy-D-xylulose-5-phosphate reductoisomerase [Planctomycetales bacterium 4484_123]|nr:MAG: 1-deoxy-D-xylulose-5-phosphate reductoisomerase [Planctomycetales bacterium 4484_123]
MSAKRIAILGSTGSVGRQALELIAASDELTVCALAAGRNWQLLAEQVGRFKPQAVALADVRAAEELTRATAGVCVLSGPEAMTELVRRVRPDMVLTAMSGSTGLPATLAAIDCKADLAVANKESLVMAGQIIMTSARSAGINVLPVDSEHSAIFQCLHGQQRGAVRRVFLTASGGPFRTWPERRAGQASLQEVLNHPTWQMGRKVTIDSATLMNKALEIVEAHWLFDLPAEKIEVLIHPESLLHGAVEFADGSVLAQLGSPSMATPIAFALHYPRRPARASAPLDLAAAGGLHFERVDRRRFPAVELGFEVLRRGGTAGAILNAADEAAVAAFVAGRIPFGRIVEIVREVLNSSSVNPEVTVESILAADAEARRRAEALIGAVEAGSGGRRQPQA